MRLRTFLRALGVAIATFACRTSSLIWFIALMVGFCALLFALVANQTPEQRQADEAAYQAQSVEGTRGAAERKAQLERTQALCKIKAICRQYGQARQECAVAGDFNHCLRVKMGDEGYEEIGSCTDDGHITGLSEPGSMDCFFNRSP